MEFVASKTVLFIGEHLLVILRDDRPDIPFPGYWDFPGGGREGAETPEQCLIRETEEEAGLRLRAADLVWRRKYETELGYAWFFAAHLPAAAAALIRLGDEGQRWDLMTPDAFCAHPKAVPQFKDRLMDYMRALDKKKPPPVRAGGGDEPQEERVRQGSVSST